MLRRRRGGQITALMGRNGSGKTTLLKLIAGLLRPQHGAVRADVRAAYVPQDADALLFSATVEDELRGQPPEVAAPFQRWLHRYPRDLSSGERQQLAIAVVAAQAEVLLLDEPTRGLDPLVKRALSAFLRIRAAAGAAILAALVAIDATLRLVIVIGLLGFSPIFFLVIAGGFVMGPSFGFASGALTLLLSAVLTAGLGPWLPYQMLAAGWVGMGAGYVGRISGREPSPRTIAVLSLYGCAAGFAYGILLDLWEWPLLVAPGSSPLSWAPGIGLLSLTRRFGGFYLATSLVYDTFRAVGNLLLVAVLGPAVIPALERFRRRFLTVWAVD